jgi:ABC-type polysaccharide transport system, permease component
MQTSSQTGGIIAAKPKALKFVSSKLVKSLKYYNFMYILLILCIAYMVVFKLIPAFNQVYYAFFQFSLFESDKFMGLHFFKQVLANLDFRRAFWNTIIFGIGMIVFFLPVTLVLSLLLNEVKNKIFNKYTQMVLIVPYFVSWVVVGGLFTLMLSPEKGPVNLFLSAIGINPIYFMADDKWFRAIFIFSNIWKNVGYSSIIYLATISTIDPQLYEAAIMDGAKKLKQIRYITLPCLSETILIVFVLQVSNTFYGLDTPMLIMYNPMVYSVADILGTLSYRRGLLRFDYSYSTVINLICALISMAVYGIGDFWSRKVSGRSLL